MAKKTVKSKTISEAARIKKRFRIRYQDGVVEIGIGCIILLLSLLNQSEHFTQDVEITRILIFVQPFLSLVIFSGGVYLIRYLRHVLLASRAGVKEIPLESPMLWVTLLMLVLLLSAPIVWPVVSYDEQIIAWVLGGLGIIAGLIVFVLGVINQFKRFMIVGTVLIAIAVLFTYVGRPGSLSNQLVILLGFSATFLISGGITLFHFLQNTSPNYDILTT
ncbi:MAG: hypothetical protein JEZ00_06280 [Anaerolineaceae bacterium]|nr:hypothetical protein [Anaerolineaceae bacterium]